MLRRWLNGLAAELFLCQYGCDFQFEPPSEAKSKSIGKIELYQRRWEDRSDSHKIHLPLCPKHRGLPALHKTVKELGHCSIL